MTFSLQPNFTRTKQQMDRERKRTEDAIEGVGEGLRSLATYRGEFIKREEHQKQVVEHKRERSMQKKEKKAQRETNEEEGERKKAERPH